MYSCITSDITHKELEHLLQIVTAGSISRIMPDQADGRI